MLWIDSSTKIDLFVRNTKWFCRSFEKTVNSLPRFEDFWKSLRWIAKICVILPYIMDIANNREGTTWRSNPYSKRTRLSMPYSMLPANWNAATYTKSARYSILQTRGRCQSVVADITDGTANIVGEIQPVHLSELLSAARESDLFTDYEKATFLSE